METILLPLLGGLTEALEPLNLTMLIIGCVVGLFVGAMPGLGSVNGVAILLPVTFLVPPETAIIFLAAVYYGAMYGGAVSSITLGLRLLRRRHDLGGAVHPVRAATRLLRAPVRAR